jgi:hypothetical protein
MSDVEWLRALLDDNVSLEAAHAAMYRRHFKGRAATSTVDALVFSLRERRTAALGESSTQYRVSQLSEQQLHEVCGRLQRLMLETPWSAGEIERLARMWMAGHA